MKKLLLIFLFSSVLIKAQEFPLNETSDSINLKENRQFSISEMQFIYNASINYDWNNTYFSTQPLSFNCEDLPPLFPTGKQMLSPLRAQYQNQQKYKMLYQILGTVGTAAALGAATYHVIKFKDEYKKDFK